MLTGKANDSICINLSYSNLKDCVVSFSAKYTKDKIGNEIFKPCCNCGGVAKLLNCSVC